MPWPRASPTRTQRPSSRRSRLSSPACSTASSPAAEAEAALTQAKPLFRALDGQTVEREGTLIDFRDALIGGEISSCATSLAGNLTKVTINSVDDILEALDKSGRLSLIRTRLPEEQFRQLLLRSSDG